MPINVPSFIIGYHGCDKDVAEDVLSGKIPLKVSKNQHDWLGSGIYFWENNPRRAYQWAKEHVGKTTANVKNPYAIGAIINPGYCLDLTEASSLEIIKDTYKDLKEVYENQGIDLPKNENVKGGDTDLLKRNLDCFVINALHDTREIINNKIPFDSVRSPFFEGQRLYETSGFYEKAHIQICVRNSSSIIGYFRVIEKGVF